MTGTVLLILRMLLLLSLYAFIGWAFWILWKDLKHQSGAAAFSQTPAIMLSRLDDETVCQFTKPDILLGRDQSSDCCLEDKTVSTQHARLSFHHSQWWLEDLNSTNGTFLNAERIDSPVVVTSGDELRCGQVGLKVTIGEAVP